MAIEYNDPLKDDFRNFMYFAFKVMGIEPHPIQYLVADWLQNAGNRRILSCMRGFGKTVMIACYISWRFHQDENYLILVQSASSERAKEIVGLVRQILGEMEITAHLIPDGRDKNIKNQAQRFDIAIRTRKAKDPSLAAYGMRSMVTGSHVDEIITDDAETMENSMTDDGKGVIMEKFAEYEDIVIADTANIVTAVGTPQTQDSVYFRLADLGYDLIRVPAEFPELDDENLGTLASFLRERLEDPDDLEASPGKPTYPERMGEEYLQNKKDITPPARYRLQMLLDPSLADEERYPLKLRHFIVFDSDPDLLPLRLLWSNESTHRVMIPVAGFRGDHVFGPRSVSDEFVNFNRKIMYVDPSGRGADHVTYTIAYGAPSYIYVPEVGGYQNGFAEHTLSQLSMVALKHNVTTIFVEANFGGGAYAELLKPHIRRLGVRAAVEDDWAKGRKELRIIDTLRPMMGSHRIVISTDVARNQELTYQISHITEERDSLEHDDYVDSFCGAVSKLTNNLGRDFVQTAEDLQEAKLKEMVDAFWKRVGQPQPAEPTYNNRFGTNKLHTKSCGVQIRPSV